MGEKGSTAGHAFVSFVKKDATLNQTVIEHTWGFHPVDKSLKALFSTKGEIEQTKIGDLGKSDFIVEVDQPTYQYCQKLKDKWDKKSYGIIANQNCVDFITEIADLVLPELRIPGKVPDFGRPPYRGSILFPKIFLDELRALNISRDTESRKLLSEIVSSPATVQLIPYRQGRKWGYCDTNKKIIIPCRFDHVNLFHEGLAAVTINEKMGYIDQTGKLVIPCKFGIAGDFNKKGTAVVWYGRSDYAEPSARINQKGQVINEKYCQWTNSTTFEPKFFDGMALVSKEENGEAKYGFINEAGELVIPFAFAKAEGFREGVCAVYDGKGKWTLIDKAGKQLIPSEEWIGYRHFNDGLAVVTKLNSTTYDHQRSGYVDHTYKTVFITGSDTRLHIYGEGLFLAEKNEKIGFVDKTGRVIIPFIYTPQDYGDGTYYGSAFKNGVAVVSKNNKLALINKQGASLTPFKYEDIDYVEELNLFKLSWQSPQTAPYLTSGYMSAKGVKYWQD
ncbi:hypothetical protein GCM10027577_26860 [Spirosoma fluminis]